MEAIINYLDTMFASLPNNPQVLKAKDELRQMMEDKYNEMISEGHTENEAVGTVISEFGNLNELSEVLGLNETMHSASAEEYIPKRLITLLDAQDYIKDRANSAMWIGLGVMLCIFCVISPILLDKYNTGMGVLGMFLLIAAGVVFIVRGNAFMNKWKYIKSEPCEISMETTKMVHEEKMRYHAAYAVQLTVGILLCSLCWLPAAVIETSKFHFYSGDLDGALLFLFVGIGVFLIVQCGNIMDGFETLLKLNESGTVRGDYRPANVEKEYINPGVTLMMHVFWPVTTAIYLCWSFITFDWHISWIIWPVAAIIHSVLDKVLEKEQY